MIIKNHKGFTIVEMIVVVTILALIVGALLPATAQTVDEQKKKVTIENMELLEKVIRDFCLANIKNPLFFPVQLDDLDDPINRGPFIIPKTQNGFVSTTEDAWGTRYQYQPAPFPNNQTQRIITSFGPNRAVGGGDDITLTVDIRDILRAETFKEIARINAAINAHNSNFVPPDPQITNGNGMGTVFTELRANNLIENGTQIERDELGGTYTRAGGVINAPNFP